MIATLFCEGITREGVLRERPHAKEKTVARTFSIDTAVEPLSLLARVKRVAGENGASLVGEERSGRFSHEMVKGQYRMEGRTVIVTITEKHWLIPWPIVESRLRALIQ